MTESYNIHLTDPLVPLFKVRAFTSDGTKFPTTVALDTTAVGANTSLLIYGKGHPNYGERIAENILHLLENFSGSSQPQFPTSGQLWFARYTIIRNNVNEFYLWSDGSSSWTLITPSPIRAEPDPIPDNEYWLDGSTLNLGINDGVHPLTGTWLARDYEDLYATALGSIPTDAPRKTLKIYNGTQWISVNASFASSFTPTDPEIGDTWFDTNIDQLKVYDGTSYVSTADAYLPLAGGTMLGDIDMGAGSPPITTIINVRDPVDRWDVASRNYVDNEILALLSGGVPTTLNSLSDVNATNILDSFIKSNGTTWENATLVVGDITDITASAAQINFLGGGTPVTSSVQSQLDGKISGGDTLGVGEQLFIEPTSVNFSPVFNELVTADWVNSTIGSVVADGALTSSAWNGTTLDLDLIVTGKAGSPSTDTITTNLAHTHDSTTILHTTYQPLLRDLLSSYPAVQLDETIEAVVDDVNERLAYLETFAFRELFTASASQTQFVLTEGIYKVGSNRLHVFVNGIKQYADERAHQGIFFDTTKNLSASSLHGLADGTYELDILIDEGTGSPLGADTVSITVVNGSLTNVTIQDIINEINGVTLTTPVWSRRETAIYIFSNISGAGSEIDITDGTTNGLLAALAAVGATTELPIYVAGNVSPSAGGSPLIGGPITHIIADRSYKEMDDDLINQGIFGSNSHSIAFNFGLVGGEVIEIISEPAFFNM